MDKIAFLDNVFPERNQIASARLERMLLFFADPTKSHARIGSPDEITNYLDYGEKNKAPFQWVQLHSGQFFNHVLLQEYPLAKIPIDEKTNNFIDEIIRQCKSRGLKISYMMGEFVPLEPFFEAYPEIRDLNTGLFWKLIYDAASALCRRFNDLDELAVYFFESKDLIHYTNYFNSLYYGGDAKSVSWPYYSVADMLRMFLSAIARACKDNGKTFCLLTHVWFPYQETLLYEALKDFPKDLPILLEHNYTTGDFNPHFPFPSLVHRLPQMKHSICYCCGMEYHGLALIPCCFPEVLQANLAKALEDSPNVTRITVRPYWDGQSLLGTPNEINLFALLRLTENPLASTEEIWDEWILERYGMEECRQELTRIFRLSYEVIKLVNFTFGVRMNDHSHLPDFDVLESRLHNYAKAIYIWNPSPEYRQTIRDMLLTPGPKIIRLNRDAHETALSYINDALMSLEAIRVYLKEDDFMDIKKRYLDMKIYTEMHSLIYDAYIRLLAERNAIEMKKPFEGNLKFLYEDIDALEQRLIGIRTEKNINYLLSPLNVESFIQKMRNEAKTVDEIFHKQM